ncbi:MAG: leucine-rich repeat protein [Wujia sp.]
MKHKRQVLFKRIMAVLVCLAMLFPQLPAYAMTTLPTEVESASDGCTMLGIKGSYYTDGQDALDRINEIRYEACEQGVPDPRDASRNLTLSDYVPLKWSQDLEQVARIRAMEGGLARTLLSSGHSRLNEKSIWTVSYNGVRSYAENLAYNYNKDMMLGIEQWYDEKADWIDTKVYSNDTGHYMSIINPNYKYIGVGAFYNSVSGYPNTVSSQMTTVDLSASGKENTAYLPAYTDIMQNIEVSDSYIDSYFLDGKSKIYIGDSQTLTPMAKLVVDSKTLNLWVIEDVTYSSSDSTIATVSADGEVTGLKKGSVVITAKTGDTVLTTLTIEVDCHHKLQDSVTVPSTCTTQGTKTSYCTVCEETVVETLPLEPHNYVYGEADSDGKSTGVCSVCGDSITIVPPTTMDLYWRNSASDDSYYWSYIKHANPVGSQLLCWIHDIDGDSDYQDVIFESSDPNIISVPTGGQSGIVKLPILSAGITTLKIYPKYNPSIARTYILRIGEPGTADISYAEVTLDKSEYSYTGAACQPTPTVTMNETKLTKGTDYTVSYENNTDAGTAKVVITGAGIFAGSIEKEFHIVGTSPVPGVSPTPEPSSVSGVSPTPGTSPIPGVTPAPTPGTGVVPEDKPVTVKTGITLEDTKSKSKVKVTNPGKVVNGKVQGAQVSYLKPKKSAAKVTIPNTVTIQGVTYKVTTISSNAFINDKKVTQVIIPSNVTTISNGAFKGCSNLSKVTLGSNVTTIGDRAFYQCSKLTSVTISSKIKKIGAKAFYGCKKLKKVVVNSKKLTKIGSKAFTGMNKNATFYLPRTKYQAYKKLLKASTGIEKTMKLKKK